MSTVDQQLKDIAERAVPVERVVQQPEPASHAPHEAAPEPLPADDDDMIEISREQMQQLCEKAQARLDNARIAVKVKQEAHAATKKTLADAIMAWQAQADPLSPEERRQREVRSHLASEQAKRAARRGVHPNAAAYVQKRMQNSGNHRGAFPRQYMGRNIRSI